MSPRLSRVVRYALLGLAALAAAGCERPPMESVQRGYRGLGMVEVYNPRIVSAELAVNEVPEVVPAVPPGGPPATSVFKNVQVLKDLSVGEFTRVMVAMTNWVAPKEGCLYCHAGNDLASDELYTKVVARRMLEMTRHINSDWKTHVADTGVTCYTCHRGQPIPANVWYTGRNQPHAGGMSADSQGQNIAGRAVGLTSLPTDPFTPLILRGEEIRVASTTALPAGNPRTIKDTEWTYALMMHMSKSLGVNCTYCHNTRSFFDWDGSTPQRGTAYYGIRMVRDLNSAYLAPLTAQFPADHLGAAGDGPKLNCATCHQGAYKPMFGASMLADYPSLAGGPVKATVTLPDGQALDLQEGSFPLAVARYLSDTADKEAKRSFVFDNLNFETGTTKLTAESEASVATLVQILKAYPATKATLEGYTDNVGDAASNQKLSLARATAIRDLLVAGGIDAARLSAEGFGDAKPVAPNDTEEGRAKNRRLELALAR